MPHQVVVLAGDLAGASPMLSSLFLDGPIGEPMNHTGLDFSAVGNHGFGQGWRELQRLQHRGCKPLVVRGVPGQPTLCRHALWLAGR